MPSDVAAETEWSSLSHAYGSASDIPGLLHETLLGDGDTSPEDLIDAGACVRCPACCHVHTSPEVRFFGFLTASAMRRILVGMLAAGIAAILVIGYLRSV